MSGSAHPFPWPAGSPATLRQTLHDALILPASVGAQLGIISSQVTALRNGSDVEFPTTQLRSIFPNGDEHPDLPADLDDATSWRLAGDSTLQPVA